MKAAASSTPFSVVNDAAHRRCVVGDEPMVFHCHHYNVSLQQALLDAGYLDLRPVLVGAGAEVAHHQLSRLFVQHNVRSREQRRTWVEHLYRWAGFGTIDLSSVGDSGGLVSTASSHYALGWNSRFGVSKEPVCYFASGFLAGAFAAIVDAPNGAYDVRHERCVASGSQSCVFELSRRAAGYEVFKSPGVGELTNHSPHSVPPNSVDYEGILKAVSGLPLVGDQQGNISAFGVYLTRHYANYYNRVSFEFLRRVTSQFGDEGRIAASALLVEAGRVCAFNTFGGIMKSSEWNALIRPSLRSQEDWVHGMVAVSNALGWGRWQVTAVSSDAAEFVVHDDYESVGYRASYGAADRPISFLAQGGVEGLMTLVYLANISEQPELNPAFYQSVFRSQTRYHSQCKQSVAMGDRVTSFLVTRHA